MRLILASSLLSGCFVFSACTGEEATPIDLHGTRSTDTTIEDPNAAVREQAKQLAADQCFEDPDLEKGVIEFVDPDTGDVVGDVIADCEAVRSQQE